MNTTNKNAKAIPSTYELKKIYRRLTCPNPDFCDREHNEGTNHHYGCLCQACAIYYYTKLK